MDVSQCPPRVMMHSYAGSVDTLHALTRLPVIGERFFFSFSHVINAEGKQAPAKLLERVRHVPEQRLLLESDQVEAPLIDRGASLRQRRQ
jgi:TatD DNase family protein